MLNRRSKISARSRANLAERRRKSLQARSGRDNSATDAAKQELDLELEKEAANGGSGGAGNSNSDKMGGGGDDHRLVATPGASQDTPGFGQVLLDSVAEKQVYFRDSISDVGEQGFSYPGVMSHRVDMQDGDLRHITTVFGGRKLPLLDDTSEDEYIRRQMHPAAWADTHVTWQNNAPGAEKLTFSGYHNVHYHYPNTDAINTHNVQNLTHAQLSAALRSAAHKEFDNDQYLRALGSTLQSDSAPQGVPPSTSQHHVKRVDSSMNGLHADPRKLELVLNEFENDYARARAMNIARATEDPRLSKFNPALQLSGERRDLQRKYADRLQQAHNQIGIAPP